MAARFCLLIVLGCATSLLLGAEQPEPKTAFRVRPYLQNPAADAMTIRWCSQSADAGTLTVDGKALPSKPLLCNELDYQGAEAVEQRQQVRDGAPAKGEERLQHRTVLADAAQPATLLVAVETQRSREMADEGDERGIAMH